MSLKAIREFLDRQDISDSLEKKMVLCIEEIFLNINEGICKHVDYQHMYGQNLLILQFNYD